MCKINAPLFPVQTSNPSSFHRAYTSSSPQYINHTSQKTLATPLRPYRKAIPLNVILSVAKNLVVAPARECLFCPLSPQRHAYTFF